MKFVRRNRCLFVVVIMAVLYCYSTATKKGCKPAPKEKPANPIVDKKK